MAVGTHRVGPLVLGVVLLAMAATAGSSSGADSTHATDSSPRHAAVAGKVVVTVSLEPSLRGTFSARGSITDSGAARGRRTISGKRVRLTLTLRGKEGEIGVRVMQLCGGRTSAWRVLSGSRAYARLHGGGAGRGVVRCDRRASYRSVLRGTVGTPATTPVAQAGTYSGTRFGKNLRAALEVLPDGRTVTNLSFRQIVARCEPPRISFLAPQFGGRYPLAEDGSFSIVAEGYLIVGKVGSGRASGTIAYEEGGCKAEAQSWTASTPPAAPPSVPQGRYCGFTLRGPGICLDAEADGWVANIRLGANVRCYAPQSKVFPVGYSYPGSIVIRPDLTFSTTLADVPLEGGGSALWRIKGTFDGVAEVTGRGGLAKVSLVRDGTRYQCRNAVSAWSARLGR